MAKKQIIKDFHEVGSYTRQLLDQARQQIFDAITALVEKMGGDICVEWYHDYRDTMRYLYYDTNYDGYAIGFYITRVRKENGDVTVYLTEQEDCGELERELAEFTATEAQYILDELEEIAICANEDGEPIRTEYEDEDEEE